MSETAPLSPREWVGAAPFPWPAARSLREGDVLRACYCVVDHTLARTRQDQPYLKLNLTDRHGTVEARVWNGALEAGAALRPGMYVGIEARVEFFNGALQLCVDALAPVQVQLEELELFLPRSRRTDVEMAHELEAWIATVHDEGLRDLLELMLGEESEVGIAFRLAPAAKHNHHAYLGGLLEHTLSVTGVCARLADHYGDTIDRDLLLAAALLHDVGKTREIGARAGFPYTDEGKLLGHILLGIQMVHDAAASVPHLAPARLLLLEHLIAAHQGRYEWQSPREPSILEGLLLHYADDLDAKFQQVSELLARAPGPWTGFDRSFRRDFLQHLPPPAPAGALEQPPVREPPVVQPPPDPIPEPPEPPLEAPPPAEVPPAEDPVPPVPPFEAPPVDDPPPMANRTGNGAVRLSEDTLDLFGEGRS